MTAELAYRSAVCEREMRVQQVQANCFVSVGRREKTIMTNAILATVEEAEARIVRFADRPIDFETFLDLNTNDEMELRSGVMVKQTVPQLNHEMLFVWLICLLYGYVRQKDLGMVLGSRSTVRIDRYHGRLPDVLFVRKENQAIMQQRAIYGTPDLVIELVSPGDRDSHLIELETDYDSIGVPEVVFINQQTRRVRVLRRRGGAYKTSILTTGDLALETVPGFVLQVEWLFADPRPDELNILTALLNA